MFLETSKLDTHAVRSSGLLASRADRVGAYVSIACAIHCMALPFVITSLPLLGIGFLADRSFETAVLIFSVLLAYASLCWGARIHGRRQILWLPAIALMLMIGGHFYHGILEAVMVSSGALCIAAGHILNRRLCSTCHSCEELGQD
jgi:hypothetical protein